MQITMITQISMQKNLLNLPAMRAYTFSQLNTQFLTAEFRMNNISPKALAETDPKFHHYR